MEDVLIPLGLLIVVGAILVALLRIAPRHDKEMNNAFEEFAMRHALRYLAEDDGSAREFAGEFEGIGELESHSGSESTFRDVVTGDLDGQRIVVFRHGDREPGIASTEWCVAGLALKNPVADHCAVQFFRSAPDPDTADLADPIVQEHESGPFRLLVRASDSADAGRLVEEAVLEQVAARAAQLDLRPELQVRANRIIAYPADRGTTIDHANSLDGLLGLVKRTVNVVRG